MDRTGEIGQLAEASGFREVKKTARNLQFLGVRGPLSDRLEKNVALAANALNPDLALNHLAQSSYLRLRFETG